jgi:hypothetical protein
MTTAIKSPELTADSASGLSQERWVYHASVRLWLSFIRSP